MLDINLFHYCDILTSQQENRCYKMLKMVKLSWFHADLSNSRLLNATKPLLMLWFIDDD